MPDSRPPDADRFGEQPEEIDEGALLFDPTGRPRDEDDEFDLPEPEGRSRSVVLWTVAAVLVLGASFGLQLVGDSEAETPTDEPMPVAPTVPIDTTSRAALTPLPTDTVEGPIGSSVRIAVRARGRSGAPARDTTVHFTVEVGDGTLESDEARTSVEGIAVSFVRLPDRPGATEITATLPGSELEATIVAVALPGAPARMVRGSGNGQEAEVGRLLPSRLWVTVYDSADNPVPEAVVSFRIGSGDGMMAPRQARTDSLGRASAVWRLGPVDGEQTLVASAPGLGQEITFAAEALPPATLEYESARPTATSPVTVVRNDFTVGGSHACSLRGGALACRGTNERGQSAPEGDLGFIALAAGSSHTCGINANGVASCWGANDEGQLGDGSREDRFAPTPVRTDLRLSQVAAGNAHTCGLAGGGVPLCWGANGSGQLGNGTRTDERVPQVVGGGLGFSEITAGWNHTCGRTLRSGNVYCWGLNSQGQLGDGTTLDRLRPEVAETPAQGLVAGSAHTCGISDGAVLCWGANDSGQLGDGSAEDRLAATPVEGLPGRATQLAAGAVHTCALLSDGRAFCWGQNRQGQLGDGTTESRLQPVPVAGDLRFRDIAAGGAQTCGTTTDGTRYCWGLNLSGQLGDGTRVNRAIPTRVTSR